MCSAGIHLSGTKWYSTDFMNVVGLQTFDLREAFLIRSFCTSRIRENLNPCVSDGNHYLHLT